MLRVMQVMSSGTKNPIAFFQYMFLKMLEIIATRQQHQRDKCCVEKLVFENKGGRA
jgi:hypothetical protein